MDNHYFNTEVAKKYGIEEAIILQNIQYWLKQNQANDKNFHEGYYWTYNSFKAFKIIFYYMSESKIKRLLNHLVKSKVLKTGNFNKMKFDRTKWYTIIDKSIINLYSTTIGQNEPIEKNEMTNATAQYDLTIPYINTDSKPDEKHIDNIDTASKREAAAFVSNIINLYFRKYNKFFTEKHPFYKKELMIECNNILKQYIELNDWLKDTKLWEEFIDLFFKEFNKNGYNMYLKMFLSEKIIRTYALRCGYIIDEGDWN